MKDEEGYLVTKEEAVWESFSEDEPASQPKPKARSQAKSSGKASGKAAGKGGNIMSFFGKK
jgi:DNA polymerase delta subunit 3